MAKTVDSMSKYIYISAYLEGNCREVMGKETALRPERERAWND
jgi:hypothetical protein